MIGIRTTTGGIILALAASAPAHSGPVRSGLVRFGPVLSRLVLSRLVFSRSVLSRPVLSRSWPRPPGDHGRIEWFEGTFDEALAEARSTRKIVFLDFFTKSCPWCKALDRDTFNETDVMHEAESFVCLPVDAESEAGKPVAERYRITGWPGLVFVEADGTLRDRLAGFRKGGQLVREFHRVQSGLGTFGELERRAAASPKDVVAHLDLAVRLRSFPDDRWQLELAAAREGLTRGEGFDPKSPGDRYAIALRLRACADVAGYEAQMTAIRALDPAGTSAPLRQIALETLLAGIRARTRDGGASEVPEIRAFLAAEAHNSVLFEGYAALRGILDRRAEKLEASGLRADAASARAESLAAAREAWSLCPPDRSAEFGLELAGGLVANGGGLDESARAFACEVATVASAAAPRSVDHLEVLASSLELAGRKDEALAALRKAAEIDPARRSVRKRLENLPR